MKGIDCTVKITPEIAENLKSQGIGFVCRYLVPDSLSLRWKRLIQSEVDALTKVGLFVVSVFETTADRAKGGAPFGTIDAREAKEEAIIIKQPVGSCVYFAVDYDAGPCNYDLIEQYLKAAKTELKSYKVGVYGSYNVVEEMAKRKACDCFWQTYAWSNGQLSKYANIYQHKNGVVLAGIQCDLDNSYGNEGGWNYMIEKKLTWQEIVEKVASDPVRWEKAVTTAVAAAKDNGSLGDLEILQYLPDLIEKIYNSAK